MRGVGPRTGAGAREVLVAIVSLPVLELPVLLRKLNGVIGGVWREKVKRSECTDAKTGKNFNEFLNWWWPFSSHAMI